jgi:hypothetical protein
MRSKVGRVVAAAGLATLLAPSAAFASWWDGGYQPAKREQPPPNQPPRRQPPPSQPSPGQPPPSEQPPPQQSPPPAEQPPAEQPPACGSCGSGSEQPPPAEQPPACGSCGSGSEQPPPAAPAQPAPPPPAPGTLPSIYGCENTRLPGTAPVLQKSTTPPPGTTVAPGQEIRVDITWRVSDWVAPELHKALDCVYIDNRYVPGLSGGERPTPNDGHFAYSYVVPPDVPSGSTICDQGFVSGPNAEEDYGREVSNVVCFPVGSPPPPAPPPPVETTTTASTAPTTTTTEHPEAEAERLSQQAPPETTAPPAPVSLAAPEVLPRTGGDPAPGRLAAGALGVAVLLGWRRRKGRLPPRRS